MKKIIIIGHRASFAGGAEDDLERILNKLNQENNFEIDLLLPFGPRIKKYKKFVNNIIIYREGYLPCFTPSKIDFLKYAVKGVIQSFEIFLKIGFHKYEICIVNVSALIVPALVIKILNPKTKIVFVVREMIKPDSLRSLIFKFINKISCGVVFVSEGIRKQFTEITNRKKNILTLFSAAEPPDNDNINENQFVEKYINKHKLEGHFILLNIGPISPVKNQKLILKSLYYLKNKGNYKIKFIHIGDYDPNYYYVKEFFKLLTDYNLEQDCFLLGVQSHELIYSFIKKSNAVLISSVTEGFPLVVSEAFMNKTLLITTDCVSKETILSDMNNCLIVKNNPEEMSQAIEFVFFNSQKKNEIVENAFSTYQSFLNLNQNLQKFSVFLLEL